MEECPYCGSNEIEYVGVEDGGGDYGTSLEDTFMCLACGQDFAGYSVEYLGDESEENE